MLTQILLIQFLHVFAFVRNTEKKFTSTLKEKRNEKIANSVGAFNHTPHDNNDLILVFVTKSEKKNKSTRKEKNNANNVGVCIHTHCDNDLFFLCLLRKLKRKSNQH